VIVFCQTEIGDLQAEDGRMAEAVSSFQKARDAGEAYLSRHPDELFARGNAAAACSRLGECLARSGRFDEAVEAYRGLLGHQRVLARKSTHGHLSMEGDEYSHFVRSLRATGRRAEAAQVAREYRARAGNDPIELYNAARLLAGCAGTAGPDEPLGATTGPAELPSVADEALAALRQAVDAGYGDLARLRSDPELDPLRPRADFQALLFDLAFSVDLFAK
jgi:tetratricopeptide (TPR) repeat protein